MDLLSIQKGRVTPLLTRRSASGTMLRYPEANLGLRRVWSLVHLVLPSRRLQILNRGSNQNYMFLLPKNPLPRQSRQPGHLVLEPLCLRLSDYFHNHLMHITPWRTMCRRCPLSTRNALRRVVVLLLLFRSTCHHRIVSLHHGKLFTLRPLLSPSPVNVNLCQTLNPSPGD